MPKDIEYFIREIRDCRRFSYDDLIAINGLNDDERFQVIMAYNDMVMFFENLIEKSWGK
jgi:hypothetical protein